MITDKTIGECATIRHGTAGTNRFGVMRGHNRLGIIDQKSAKFARECLVFEVCQPQQAKEGARGKQAASLTHKEGSKTVLATLKPSTLLPVVDPPELKFLVQEAEDTTAKMMKELAS